MRLARPLVQTWQVTRADLVRYAGAARDFNPIHYDDAAARAAGFSGPIAHGMLTLGRLLAAVVDQEGLCAVGSVSCRFTGPAAVGSTLTFEGHPQGSQLAATVAYEAGASVLVASIDADRAPQPSLDGLEPVADRLLVVERGPAMRFAETVGARSRVFCDHRAAAAEGYAAVPAFPTYVVALPGWGWFPDMPGNEAGEPPDAVRDCARWAETTAAVVHAGQRLSFRRPLYLGETVRARSYVTARSTKTGSRSTLRFTDVTTVVTSPTDSRSDSRSDVLNSTMSLVVQDPIPQEER